MKTGLVLEGGAMRGMYSAGVMDNMFNKNISFDGIIGVSAGASLYESKSSASQAFITKAFQIFIILPS